MKVTKGMSLELDNEDVEALYQVCRMAREVLDKWGTPGWDGVMYPDAGAGKAKAFVVKVLAFWD